MILIYGVRPYGKVNQCGTTYIATRFVHLYFMPLIPLGSQLVLQEDVDAGAVRAVPLGLHLQSTVTGYARTWGVLLSLGLLIAALCSFGAATSGVGVGAAQAVLLGAVQLLGAVLLAVAWWRLGRPRLEQRAQQMTYADFAGYPVDVATLPPPAADLTQSLRQVLRERGRSLSAGDYRTAVDPDREWPALAQDPRVEDLVFLKAALTLARVEWRQARGKARAELRDVHSAIWRRLKVLDPSVLTTAQPL